MNFMDIKLLSMGVFLALWLFIGLLVWYQTKKRKKEKQNDEIEDNIQRPLYLEREKRTLLHTTEIIR